MSAKGVDMEKIHSNSIYGDEKTGKFASEIFTEKDVIKTFDDADLVYNIANQQILSIGKRLNFLTRKEEEEFTMLNGIEQIKKLGFSEKFNDFVKSKFACR